MNNTKMNITILGAERYSFQNEKKEVIQGAKLVLIDDTPQGDPNKLGKSAMMATCEYELLDKMKNLEFPCTINSTLSLKPVKNKKNETVITFHIHDVEVPPQHSAKKAA